MTYLCRFAHFSQQYARKWPTFRNIGPCKVTRTPIRRCAITTTTTSTSTSTSTTTTTTATTTTTTTAGRTPHTAFLSRTRRLRRIRRLKRTRATETHAYDPSHAPPLKQRHALRPTDANTALAPTISAEDKATDRTVDDGTRTQKQVPTFLAEDKATDKSVDDETQRQRQKPTFLVEDKTIDKTVDDGARSQTQVPSSRKAQALAKLFDMYAEEEEIQPKGGRNGNEEQDGPVLHDPRSRSRTAAAAQVLQQLINTPIPPTPPILSSRPSASSKRESTRSPTKTLAHLQQLHKPVVYNSDEASVRKLIPDDVRSLWDDLQQLCKGESYIPARLRGLDCDIDIDDENELCHAHDTRTDLQLAFEYETLRTAQTSARKYDAEGDGETQWYCAVHWPILDAAFKLNTRLDPKAVTHARPINAFLPRIGTQMTKSKLVDFAVNLVLPSPADGGPDLNAWLAAQPASTATVNQSLAGSLTRNPTLLPIEVKTGQGIELEAQMQMGIWVSAWHGRIRALRHANKEKGAEEDRRIFTLPVIITSVHVWQLYFAVDQGDRIEMLRFPGEIGGTLSLPKCYRLVECLRRIGRYGVEGFEPWVLETFRFGGKDGWKDGGV